MPNLLLKRERGAAAALLLLATVLQLFAMAAAPASSGHKCGHASCPMRHSAMAEFMKCHGQAPAPASCSIRAGCDCGRDHLPFAPHRQIEGVLPSVVSVLILDPFQSPFLPVDGVRLLLIRGPEAPPPRFLPA